MWSSIDTEGNIELAYWRKCWGIRDKILDALEYDNEGNGTYRITYSELKTVIEVLKKFLDKEYWDENADSIWDYDEFYDNQKKNIKQLKWAYTYMRWHPEAELFFYDSY